MHYYQFNIGDYASHTVGLSPIEDIIYRRLIDRYYLDEQPLNECSTTVARLIGMRDYVEEVDYILTRFFVKNDNNEWAHSRIDKEIAEYKDKQEKNSRAGKASAKARKANKNNAIDKKQTNERLTSVKQTLNERSTNHKPITNNQEPLTNNQITTKTQVGNLPIEIFNYWKDVMKKGPTAKPSEKRIKKVKERLKEGYSIEFIKQAIYGCSITPHNNGTDPSKGGQKYDDLELICRTPEHLERFASNAESLSKRPNFSSATERTANNIMNVKLD